jgi:hypothetical protein
MWVRGAASGVYARTLSRCRCVSLLSRDSFSDRSPTPMTHFLATWMCGSDATLPALLSIFFVTLFILLPSLPLSAPSSSSSTLSRSCCSERIRELQRQLLALSTNPHS